MDLLCKVYHRAGQVPLDNVKTSGKHSKHSKQLNRITARKKVMSGLSPAHIQARTLYSPISPSLSPSATNSFLTFIDDEAPRTKNEYEDVHAPFDKAPHDSPSQTPALTVASPSTPAATAHLGQNGYTNAPLIARSSIGWRGGRRLPGRLERCLRVRGRIRGVHGRCEASGVYQLSSLISRFIGFRFFRSLSTV